MIQAYAITPGSFNDVIELLLPELKRRGLFWDDYEVDGGFAAYSYIPQYCKFSCAPVVAMLSQALEIA